MKSIPTGGEEELAVIVTVKKHMLLTTHQPFSIVITGDFEWEKVDVDDSRWRDYEDKPQTERYGTSKRGYWIVIAALAVFVCASFVICLVRRKSVRNQSLLE